MAICSQCGGEMTDGISCLTDPLIIDSRAYAPVRWGQELRPRHRYEPEECRDCGTPLGGVHHPGCCIERCPACHGQAISCGCFREPDCGYAEPAHAALPLPRTAPGGLALTCRRCVFGLSRSPSADGAGAGDEGEVERGDPSGSEVVDRRDRVQGA